MKVSSKKSSSGVLMRYRIIENAGVLFAQNGFFGTSMQDIADSLLITKAALYYHYQSKNEIYLALVDMTFKELEKNISRAVAKGKTPAEKLCLAIEAYFHFAKDRPQVRFLSLPAPEKLGEELAKSVLNLNRELFNTFSTLIMDVVGKNSATGEEKRTVLNVIWNALISFPQQLFFPYRSYKRAASDIAHFITYFANTLSKVEGMKRRSKNLKPSVSEPCIANAK